MQSKKPDTNLDAAMSLLIDAWESGCWLSPERSGVSCSASPYSPTSQLDPALVQRVKSLQPALREVLTGNRKEWAERRDEFAFAPVFRNGELVEAGLVLIEQRRAIGPGMAIADPAAAPRRFRTCNGVILRQGQTDKEAVAWWLWELGLLRSDVYIIEVPDQPGEDYRDLISGSHWLKSSVRPAPHQAVGQALFLAMQARSFRKEAIRAGRTGWWQALAAAFHARREGISGEEACKRLGLDWASLRTWIEKALSYKPRRRSQPRADKPSHAPDLDITAAPAEPARAEPATQPAPAPDKPVTDKQRAIARTLVAKHAELAPLFAEGWDRDRREASRRIGRAIAAADQLEAAAERHRQEIAGILKQALAD